MGEKKKRLPIGVEDFEEIWTEGFYYVDKTDFIRDLLRNWGEVNLFTRPRRFGKSLNMSMLRYFFEPGHEQERIFGGLEISKEKELCEKYMGKYPVISVSLKGISAGCYETARSMAVRVINEEADRLRYLLKSDRLEQDEKESFAELLRRDMDDAALYGSLRELTRLLRKHYGQKVILLIDEYDVPLAKAFDNNYYDQMILLIRNMFEHALKTNGNLQFAVLTGCMRISKESIFTGLNNLKVLSVADAAFSRYFGFTDQEVRELLDYYGLSHKYDTIREWYDGYQFGDTEVYCPWDVICYCDKLRTEEDAWPQNYWSNTSGNDSVRRFIREADSGTTKREIEKLVAGEVIEKEIHQELTYRDMYDSIDHIWSVLYMTGYLTRRGKMREDRVPLAIPNVEIRKIFTEQIMTLFKENVKKDGSALEAFCRALEEGDATEVEKRFGEYLRRTISIRDTFVKREMKENFYHGILLGLAGFKDSWIVSSNRESGDGYSDILIETEDGETGIIIEVKYSHDGNLEKCCQEALEQIGRNRYEAELREEGTEHILKYGIACYKKRCKVVLQ